MALAPVIANLCGFKLIVTFGLSEFKFYDEIFYIDYKHRGRSRKKRVPKIVHELLTPRALAYWFMDDGSGLVINQKRYYLFSTQSFPKEDQEILVQALKDNFDIYSKALFLDATYRLYIRSKSTNRFVDLIRPGLRPPCFAYKI